MAAIVQLLVDHGHQGSPDARPVRRVDVAGGIRAVIYTRKEAGFTTRIEA